MTRSWLLWFLVVLIIINALVSPGATWTSVLFTGVSPIAYLDFFLLLGRRAAQMALCDFVCVCCFSLCVCPVSFYVLPVVAVFFLVFHLSSFAAFFRSFTLLYLFFHRFLSLFFLPLVSYFLCVRVRVFACFCFPVMVYFRCFFPPSLLFQLYLYIF